MQIRGSVAAGALILMAIAWGLPSWTAAADNVARMAKEELKGRLGSADVAIVDVRAPADWRRSERKIAGAVREAPGEARAWAEKYGRDKTIVLYCA